MEKQVIQSVGFRNICENGTVTGFQFKIRLPYYRGVFLSQLMPGTLFVDGERIEKEDITSPLGIAEASVPTDTIVAAAILRAGLPLHQGIINIFDNAENAFVSAYRRYDADTDFNFDISIEYISAPSLDGKVLIICDPMLATGSSMQLAYEALLAKGTPTKLFICSVIASCEAMDYLEENLPEDAVVFVAAVDDMLNQHKYIVPGLGDAGNLAFGEKE